MIVIIVIMMIIRVIVVVVIAGVYKGSEFRVVRLTLKNLGCGFRAYRVLGRRVKSSSGV